MRFTLLKHLLICLCVFALLESTGISVLSVIAEHHISQTDSQLANDDENTAEHNETKGGNPKELWAVNPATLPQVYIAIKTIIYPYEKHTAHLAWVPPVPTPPPNA
ncbi:hypothetical protein NAF17_11095 [Mucilaginibacter sp. RB4R14]|uniref:hypothetical protein n=1 Tax=Mucilaginibacter aurantiaciroseus TaxID=2949308 RepID=UPI002091B14B|nr:hypothetical protein [Mucilaginibacter aurantiaciroseus]MCO5936085.1 hypothetical protein [Mucilaginibacter aurantiaciroseus]